MSHTKRILKPAELPKVGRIYHGDANCYSEWLFLDIKPGKYKDRYTVELLHRSGVGRMGGWGYYHGLDLKLTNRSRQHLHEID